MEDGVGARDDPSERHREDQRDDELRKRWQGFNLETEITLLKARDAPAGDPAQELVGRKLVLAHGLLGLAVERGVGFADALDAANEVLELDPASSEAFAIRALAYSRLDGLYEAVDDAETAIALNPGDPSLWGVTMRRELPSWREALGTSS
jgi:tetratricopeptide (TPR) repeat protein